MQFKVSADLKIDLSERSAEIDDAVHPRGHVGQKHRQLLHKLGELIPNLKSRKEGKNAKPGTPGVALPGYHMLTFTIDGARYVFVPLDLPSRRLAYTCSPVVSSAPVTATR